MQQNTWFIPEGLEDLLPSEAQKLEFYRRLIVDEFRASGYQLVLPPMAEFTDALLTGTASQMAVDTCRFTDQESGKMMGVRSDLTPQVARIVVNRMKQDTATIKRLCYVAEVLKTRNNKAKGSRSPIQAGVELFGHSGVESDIEVMQVMLSSLKSIGLEDLTMSIGDVSFVNELIALAGLNESQASELIDILQRKAVPEYEAFVEALSISDELRNVFTQFLLLTGSPNLVCDQAAELLGGLSDSMAAHIARVKEVVNFFENEAGVTIHLDLADLRGYQYHTGIIYSCYAAGRKMYLLAKGGRYDNATQSFGEMLPATGFSMDLRGALDLLGDIDSPSGNTVYAPIAADASLKSEVARLKAENHVVQYFYSLSDLPAGAKVLVSKSGKWIVK